jgi:G5 domain
VKRINYRKKSIMLLSWTPKIRRAALKTGLIAAFIISVIGAIPFPHAFTKTASTPFATNTQQSAELELNDSKVIQEGINGTRVIHVDSLQSLWGRIFGQEPIRQKEMKSTTSKTPVNKIVAEGTLRFQYMLCSDGSYRYYTDEQFKQPKTGFTSKSEDACKNNNKGEKLSLTNNAPTNFSGSSTSKNYSSQTDTYAADKIDRETAKLNWCSQEDEKISNQYIGKVHQAQSAQGISNEEFNAIVDPAYFQYSNQVSSLRAAGCTISVSYPNYTR